MFARFQCSDRISGTKDPNPSVAQIASVGKQRLTLLLISTAFVPRRHLT
jgi:hypothetical protein